MKCLESTCLSKIQLYVTINNRNVYLLYSYKVSSLQKLNIYCIFSMDLYILKLVI